MKNTEQYRNPSILNILLILGMLAQTISPFHTIAQTKLIDSLRNELSELPPFSGDRGGLKADTTRIKLLNTLAWQLKYQNPDTSILLGKQALSILTVIARNEVTKQSLATKHTIQTLTANTNSNLGVCYWLKGDNPLSLSHHFKALHIRKHLNTWNGIAASLSNISIVYCDQSDYPRALKRYFEALEIGKELGDKRSIAKRLGNIGSLYTKQKKYKEAEEYLLQSLEGSKEIGVLFVLKDHQQYLSRLYIQTQNYPLALYHYKQYDTAKDSLYNEEKSKEIGKLEMKHEMEIVEFNRKQKEAQEAEAAQIKKAREDKIGYTLVLVGFILVLAIAMLLSRLILPEAVIQIATTIPFLLLFETAIVFLDPHIEAITENAPALKLTSNFILAFSIFPVHNKAERLLKHLFRRKLRKKVERRKARSSSVISSTARNLDQKNEQL
ncbi:tetratricopeptide repeat protein [Candidatus Amoebophilus asiaticus]|nr:tetratricopeptide repeat protein [Candidatus Amoebophilus asiaticus]